LEGKLDEFLQNADRMKSEMQLKEREFGIWAEQLQKESQAKDLANDKLVKENSLKIE
jgi:hypothetical protein